MDFTEVSFRPESIEISRLAHRLNVFMPNAIDQERICIHVIYGRLANLVCSTPQLSPSFGHDIARDLRTAIIDLPKLARYE